MGVPRTSGPATVIKQSSVAGHAPALSPANATPGVTLPVPTATEVQDPASLTRYIRNLVQSIVSNLQTSATGLFRGEVLVSNIKVTAGQTTTVAHQLGRRIKGRILSGYTYTSGTDDGVIHAAALPAGRDPQLYFAFSTQFTGTVDIVFF